MEWRAKAAEIRRPAGSGLAVANGPGRGSAATLAAGCDLRHFSRLGDPDFEYRQ